MPSLSPQVQQFSQVPPEEQAEQMFKEKFTQVAYSVLFSKFADLAEDVVTFKILETDPSSGNGVGAFVVLRENHPIYIPAIMTDGQLKPMEMFYYKDLNIFLPLDNMWLDEVSKMTLDEMGESQKIPDDVPRDLNVRNVTLPPLPAGRYGYASAEDEEHDHDHNIKKMLKESQDQSLEIHPAFLDTMKKAPKVVLDGVKVAFERHPALLQKFAQNYGTTKLVEAFQTGYDSVKEAAAPEEEGKIDVFTKEASPQELKDAFGSSVGDAFSAILKNGYAVNDTRKGIHKVAVKLERTTFLDSPGSQGGWFRLYFADGPADIYFVFPWPKKACAYESIPHDGPHDTHRRPVEYLVVNKDGKEAWTCTDVMGERILDPETVKGTKLYKLMEKGGGSKPTVNSYGFYMNTTSKAMDVTTPFKVESVSQDEGRTKVKAAYGGTTLIQDDDEARQRIQTVDKLKMCFVPKSAKWIEIAKIKEGESPYDYTKKHTSLIKDPKLLSRWLNSKLNEAQAKNVVVKSAGLDQWWVNHSDRAYGHSEALAKVAELYEISAADAEGILKDAQENRISGAYVLDIPSAEKLQAELEKIAQPPMPAPQQGAPMPQQGAPMPPQPGQPPMDPMAMGGMAPPMAQSPLSPTDLAIAETVDELKKQNDMQMQQQQMQMQQQQQSLQIQQENTEQLIGVLEHIQQRARDISGATGGVVPEGAEGAPAAAAGMLSPQSEEPPPPPMPVMEGDASLTPEMIADQINPGLVDQAAELQDSGTFDTAALAMLSTAPALQDIVASYVPNMEKCLDNLGRILLTLWLTEDDTKEAIGDETYIMLEDKLRTIFKGLGDVILSISHNAPSASSGQGYVGDAQGL